MRTKRIGLTFFILGLVLAPGPIYAIALEAVDSPEQTRSPTGYVATDLNVSNEALLAEKYANTISFDISDLRYPHVRDGFAAPNRTRALLREAIRNGSSETTASTVESDLHRIQQNSVFITIDKETYYETTVTPTEAGVLIETRRVNETELAESILANQVVRYDSLSPTRQSTFDKIRNVTTSPENSAYRPWSTERVPDPSTIVYKDGHYYEIVARVHVDDFGLPDGLLIGIGSSIVGIASLLLAGGFFIREKLEHRF